MNSLLGPYNSDYTMLSGGATEVVSDCITFEPGQRNNQVIGKGLVDTDGYTMRLILEDTGTSVMGIWQEVKPDGEVAYSGKVDLSTHNSKILTGLWSMESADSRTAVIGTWLLVKRLGNEALNS